MKIINIESRHFAECIYHKESDKGELPSYIDIEGRLNIKAYNQCSIVFNTALNMWNNIIVNDFACSSRDSIIFNNHPYLETFTITGGDKDKFMYNPEVIFESNRSIDSFYQHRSSSL